MTMRNDTDPRGGGSLVLPWMATILVASVPSTAWANGLDDALTSMLVLVVTYLLDLVAMTLLIVFAVKLGRRRRDVPREGERRLVRATRVTFVVGVLVSLIPLWQNLAFYGTHDLEWVLLLTLGGGLLCYVPGIIALVSAARLVRARHDQESQR